MTSVKNNPPESNVRKITRADLDAAVERLSNWGRWGENDEIGTLNFTEPNDIVRAAGLIRTGRVISLALNYDKNGPQGGKTKFPAVNRFNPVHTMLRSGSDAFCGSLDHRGLRSADDMVLFPLAAGTHWDGLGHIFFDDRMWNGYDCREVSSFGAARAGIHHTKEKMVGRGVLLDIARHMGMDWLPDGFPVTEQLLNDCCASQGVSVGRGDHLLVRTGHMERCLGSGSWDGYPGGDAPGLAFSTLDWLHDRQIAAIATDTWGVEVRPNNSEGINQPWHWISIPIMGLSVGEIFKLDELARVCAEDSTYEFFFVAPALPITGAVGSPVNPIVIR